MMSFNVMIEERSTGRLAYVFIDRTAEEIRSLFQIGINGTSPIEDIIGVRLIELTANEYICAGYYVRIIERENWLAEHESRGF